MVNPWIPVKQSRVAQKDPLPTALHDLRHVGRDLFGHKGATASRTLVVEEDAVAGKPRDDKKAVLQWRNWNWTIENYDYDYDILWLWWFNDHKTTKEMIEMTVG